jgi:RNA polymerase sigma-70 factor (ECF subfamily)
MTLSVQTDGELMAEVSAGNVQAFVELYDRYHDRAYRVARSICHDDTRAQDAVQEAFLSVWKRRDSYRPLQGTPAAWLLTVVRYRAIDLTRSHARHTVPRTIDVEVEKFPAPDDVAETVIRREQTDRLHASLATLPEAQAEVIALAYYGQLSHTAIARELGLPTGTVKGRMRLGLQKLRDELQPAAA